MGILPAEENAGGVQSGPWLLDGKWYMTLRHASFSFLP